MIGSHSANKQESRGLALVGFMGILMAEFGVVLFPGVKTPKVLVPKSLNAPNMLTELSSIFQIALLVELAVTPPTCL